MSDTYDTVERLRPPTHFLAGGDSYDLDFRPQAGLVTASVGWVRFAYPPEDTLTAGDRAENPGLRGPLPVNVSFQIALYRPGVARPVRERHVTGNALRDTLTPLTYVIPAEQAGGSWRCRFTNTGAEAVRFRPWIDFVSRSLPLQRTHLPLRVLNHGLSQLLSALDLRVHLDGERSYVDFSEEFKELTGGAVTRRRLEIEALSRVEDVNLSAIDIAVVSPLHTRRGQASWGPPAIRIQLQFETKGEEIDTGFVDVDVEHAALTVHLGLAGDFDSQGRPTGRVRITPTVRAGLRGRVYDDVWNNLLSLAFFGLRIGTDRRPHFSPDTLEDIRSSLETGVAAFLADALPAIGDYLGRGLAELCRRGDRFYDVASDATSLIVTHYAVEEPAPLSLTLIEDPPTINDRIAAARADHVGLDNLDKIETIVVLVQENRSFDHLLGYLRKDGGRNDVDGLVGTESNSAPGRRAIAVNALPRTVFDNDPPHDHKSVLRQIGDGAMDGFLTAFIDHHPGVNPAQIMGYHTKTQLPTYDYLARQFLICDRWFASHPGPTQPNRMALVLGGRIPELENLDADSPAIGFVPLPTLFDVLTDGGVDWVYYEHDVAFLRLFDRYRLDDTHLVPFDDPRDGFRARAAAGTLPPVTFIEPAFLGVLPAKPANDDHPPADLRHGQNLVACIHNALVTSPQWGTTMFVVTYDEHGGFFDHVPPPGTARSTMPAPVPPLHRAGPSFLGSRVPAFVVSPWVEPGAVDHTVFDHTSIAKTILLRFLRQRGARPTSGGGVGLEPRSRFELVRPRFELTRPLSYPTMTSRRLVHAAHLGGVLTQEAPRLDMPLLPADCAPPPPIGRLQPQVRTAESSADFHEGMRRLGQPGRHRR